MQHSLQPGLLPVWQPPPPPYALPAGPAFAVPGAPAPSVFLPPPPEPLPGVPLSLPTYLLPAQRHYAVLPAFPGPSPTPDVGQPALADRFPDLSCPASPSQFQHLNESLLRQIHDLVRGSGATVTTESGAQLNPLEPVSLADPHTMSMHARVRELERILLPSELEQVESIQDYYTRAAKRALLSPSISDAAARAVALLHFKRADDTERLAQMTNFGGAGKAGEPLFVKELIFKHSLGSADPMMRAAENVGARLFKENRKRLASALGLHGRGAAQRARLDDGPGGKEDGAVAPADPQPLGLQTGSGCVLGGGRVGGVGGTLHGSGDGSCAGGSCNGGCGAGSTAAGGGPPTDRHCFWCKARGHLMANCPLRASGTPRAPGPTPQWPRRAGRGPGGRGPRRHKT